MHHGIMSIFNLIIWNNIRNLIISLLEKLALFNNIFLFYIIHRKLMYWKIYSTGQYSLLNIIIIIYAIFIVQIF